jgi:hypothetical protein
VVVLIIHLLLFWVLIFLEVNFAVNMGCVQMSSASVLATKYEEGYYVSIKPDSGPVYNLTIQPTVSIRELKILICERQNLKPDSLQLAFGALVLDENCSFADQLIPSGAEIQIKFKTPYALMEAVTTDRLFE